MQYRLTIKKKSFFYYFWFYFFSISNIANLLEDFGIPKYLPYGVYIVMLALFVLKTFKTQRLYDILIQLVICICVLYAIVVNGRYIETQSSLFATILLFMPAYYCFRLSNSEDLLKGFSNSAYLSIFLLLFRYLFIVKDSDDSGMSYAYSIAIPLCVLFFNFLTHHKVLDLVVSLFSYFSLFLTGSRGGLLFTTICLIILYLSGVTSEKKEFIRVGLFSTIFAIIYFNLDRLLLFLSNYSQLSRNLSKLVSGEFLISNTRNVLYEKCIYFINNNPKGYGPMGSRPLLLGLYPYPHSLWYELQLDFGKHIGILLFIVVIVMAVILMIKSFKTTYSAFITTLCVLGLCSLMTSSTLYQEYCIPAILGVFVSWKSKGDSFVFKDSLLIKKLKV